MSEQFLNRPDIVSPLDQMGGKAVPQGMACDPLSHAALSGCSFDCFLDRTGGDMESGDLSRFGKDREPR